MTDRSAILAILLDATGLSVAEAAKHVGVQYRSMRRWLDGEREVPANVISQLDDLREHIDLLAQTMVKTILDRGSPHVLVVCRFDDDVGEKSLPTASAHRSMVRRVFERIPDRCYLIVFDRDAYRSWLGKRKDTPEMRALWATEMAPAAGGLWHPERKR